MDFIQMRGGGKNTIASNGKIHLIDNRVSFQELWLSSSRGPCAESSQQLRGSSQPSSPAPSSNAVATREQRLYTTGLKDGKRPASCQGQDVNRLDIFSCVGVPAAHHHQRVVEQRHSEIIPSNRHWGHLHSAHFRALSRYNNRVYSSPCARLAQCLVVLE